MYRLVHILRILECFAGTSSVILNRIMESLFYIPEETAHRMKYPIVNHDLSD